MKKSIFFLAGIAFFAMACNNGNNTQQPASPTDEHSTAHPSEATAADHSSEMHATTNDAEVRTVTVKFKDLNNQTSQFVKAVVSDYLKVKKALVASNERSAAKASLTLHDHLTTFDKSYFTTAQKEEYDAIDEALRTASAEFATQDLETQRKTFKLISEKIYLLAKNFDTGQPLYKEYCPMYEGGAAWISAEKEIQNPYFGDKMMKCGTVQEVIQ